MLDFRTRNCIHCGKASIVSLDVEKVIRWQGGAHVQTVWPEMTPEERELLVTGTHPECWDIMFPEEEE